MNRGIISCLIALLLSFAFAACPGPDSEPTPTGSEPTPVPPEERKITLKFNNYSGKFKVSVYHNSERKDGQKIVDVKGFDSSQQISWTPSEYTFYFAYDVFIDGIPISYVPPENKGMVSDGIKENEINIIQIPLLSAIVSPDDLLTKKIYLSIENRGPSGLQVLQGGNPLPLLDATSSIVNIVNTYKKGKYTISADVQYKVGLLSGEEYLFPFLNFEPGYWYSFIYNTGKVSLVDKKQIILANVDNGIELPAPDGLKAESFSASSVKLSWKKVEVLGVKGYNVYYSRNASASEYKRYSDSPQTNTEQWINGLDAETTYYFKVSTVNRAGDESLVSDSVTVKTGPAADYRDSFKLNLLTIEEVYYEQM